MKDLLHSDQVADILDCKIKLKAFHSEIQDNNGNIRLDEEKFKQIQIINVVTELEIQGNYLRIQ